MILQGRKPKLLLQSIKPKDPSFDKSLRGKCKSTILLSNGGISTIGQRARAPVANSSHVIRVSTEIPRRDSTKPFKKRLINVKKRSNSNKYIYKETKNAYLAI